MVNSLAVETEFLPLKTRFLSYLSGEKVLFLP